MPAAVKICGLTEPEGLNAAVNAGARFTGFVFFPKSPRNLARDQAAMLARSVPTGIARVGLFVNPDDALLQDTLVEVPLDIVQLHGHESPERVGQIRQLTGLAVMKAVGVAEAEDLGQLWDYGLVADMLLVDAKPPKDADLPGGNGLTFDWRLLAGKRFLKPWFLAGGLTPENVAEAIRLTRPDAVDVSSGVESGPGQKDPDRVRAFIAAAS